MEIELDRVDFKILDNLQQNNTVTIAELSNAVGVSMPTCLRRLRRLRDNKVIVGDVCLIDPDKVGSFLMLVVEIELNVEDRKNMDGLEKVFRANPNVLHCYLVTGEVDYVLFMAVKDMRSYEEFARDVLYANKSIKRFRTLTVIHRIKYDTRLPLPFTQKLSSTSGDVM